MLLNDKSADATLTVLVRVSNKEQSAMEGCIDVYGDPIWSLGTDNADLPTEPTG